MTEAVIKVFIIGKINEWVRKRVLEEEIISKAAKGVDKLNNIINKHVWENIEGFINSAKEKDNKFIPNFLEEFSEDLFSNIFAEVRKNLDLRNLLESILKEEKTEIGI